MLFAPIEITELGSSRCSSVENLAAAAAAASSANGYSSPSSTASLLDCSDLDNNSLDGGQVSPSYYRNRPNFSRKGMRSRCQSTKSLSKEEWGATLEIESERLLDERQNELKKTTTRIRIWTCHCFDSI